MQRRNSLFSSALSLPESLSTMGSRTMRQVLAWVAQLLQASPLSAAKTPPSLRAEADDDRAAAAALF